MGMGELALVEKLVLAAFAFAAGSYGFTWLIYDRLRKGQARTHARVDDLYTLVTNHHEHRFEDVENRLRQLEQE